MTGLELLGLFTDAAKSLDLTLGGTAVNWLKQGVPFIFYGSNISSLANHKKLFVSVLNRAGLDDDAAKLVTDIALGSNKNIIEEVTAYKRAVAERAAAEKEKAVREAVRAADKAARKAERLSTASKLENAADTLDKVADSLQGKDNKKYKQYKEAAEQLAELASYSKSTADLYKDYINDLKQEASDVNQALNINLPFKVVAPDVENTKPIFEDYDAWSKSIRSRLKSRGGKGLAGYEYDAIEVQNIRKAISSGKGAFTGMAGNIINSMSDEELFNFVSWVNHSGDPEANVLQELLSSGFIYKKNIVGSLANHDDDVKLGLGLLRWKMGQGQSFVNIAAEDLSKNDVEQLFLNRSAYKKIINRDDWLDLASVSQGWSDWGSINRRFRTVFSGEI